MPGRSINIDQWFGQDAQPELTVRPAEKPEDRDLRLFKERWTFVFKELGPMVVGSVLLFLIVICCSYVLMHDTTPPQDHDKAWNALYGVLGVILGAIFTSVRQGKSES